MSVFKDLMDGASSNPEAGAEVLSFAGTIGSIAKVSVGSRLTIMCPCCYNLYRLSADGSITIRTDDGENCDLIVRPAIHIQCTHCEYEGDAIILDNGIAACVSLLNRMGFKTEMSCDGHYSEAKNRNGVYRTFIKFAMDSPKPTVPEGWEYNGMFLESYNDSHISRRLAIGSLYDHISKTYTNGST